MSFFTNNRTDRCPGPITGNPLTGLCEKVCIQTSKVFDSGISQVPLENYSLTLSNLTPAGPTYPLTFVGCATNGVATLTNVVVDRFDDKPNFARITCTVNIPLLVTYTDAGGITGTGTGTISINKDVVMFVPQASLIPYTIEGFGAAVCLDGTFTGETPVVVINGCANIILRVIVEAHLLIPSYGYCCIPESNDYTQELCSGITNLPLFPN